LFIIHEDGSNGKGNEKREETQKEYFWEITEGYSEPERSVSISRSRGET